MAVNQSRGTFLHKEIGNLPISSHCKKFLLPMKIMLLPIWIIQPLLRMLFLFQMGDYDALNYIVDFQKVPALLQQVFNSSCKFH
jgi:hypothetical protein